jgi:hypothetical protein
MSSKIRLGGMALVNGVLVHGPTSWACAIRTDSGEIKVAGAHKRLLAAKIQQPFLRRSVSQSRSRSSRAPPQTARARLPFERPTVLAATLASAVTVGGTPFAPARRRGSRAPQCALGGSGRAGPPGR